jgi:two-component system, chemotaxis family, protein-glutamate methylesterase/glutaminase
MINDVPALVVVGASAGGLAVLRRLLGDLPRDLPAAVLAVVHLPRRPQRPLADLVGAECPLPVHEAASGEPLRVGTVLVAPPDRHLELVDGTARLSETPPLNGVRPSVDVLFTSAAKEFPRRVVAVVLSGAMHDGAAGSASVERAGGRVLVQDPDDALVTGMPVSALAATGRHDVAPGAGLGPVVRRLVDDLLAPA